MTLQEDLLHTHYWETLDASCIEVSASNLSKDYILQHLKQNRFDLNRLCKLSILLN